MPQEEAVKQVELALVAQRQVEQKRQRADWLTAELRELDIDPNLVVIARLILLRSYDPYLSLR